MPNTKRPTAPKRDEQNFSTITSTEVDPKVAAALSYILGIVTGMIFLVLEKQNRFVRFHAAQSIVVSLFLVIVAVGVSMIGKLLAFLPVVGWMGVLVLTLGLALGSFGMWLVLMWRAYEGN